MENRNTNRHHKNLALGTVVALCGFLTVPVLVGLYPTEAIGVDAAFKVVGKGKEQRLDTKGFPDDQLKRYKIFAAKCTKCHTLVRPLSAVSTGVTPVTGDPFDARYVSKYVGKMMRKLNSGIVREDAQEIARFLIYALKLKDKDAG